ncbi:MAG: metal-dependent hydrolase, partial [Kofleriaceae bacterium]
QRRPIEVRDLAFTFAPEAVPLDWCSEDAFTTTFLSALSLLFPDGEKFFVESLKQIRERVHSPELRARIAGFLGQEAMHGRGHRALDELFVAHGFDAVPGLERQVRGFLKTVRRVLPPMSQVAATCALEHFTALLAEALLRDNRLRDEIHPSVRTLWVWHAFEESEHKAVAYDAYQEAGGGYARRVAMMVVATWVFFTVHMLVHARLMQQRGILGKPWRWLHGIRRMWLSPGYFTRLVPAYFSYYKPGFHPDDRETGALLAQWKQVLFGPDGKLAA